MTRRLAVILALALAGCATGDKPVPGACLTGRAAVERALATAPGHVALADGTRLSVCVERARADADLQDLGYGLTQAADGLALRAPHDPAGALRLGYLIGAVRRGAARSNGVALELKRRIEQTAVRLDRTPARIQAALARGLRAGEASG